MLASASPGGVCSRGVSAPRGSAPGGWGGLVPGGGGVWSREVGGLVPGGGGSGPGGVCSGGSGPGGGVCSRKCLLRGVSAPGGGIPACTEADTLPPWTESQTPVKTLPWPNFVAADKYKCA